MSVGSRPELGATALQKRARQFEQWGYPISVVDQAELRPFAPGISPGSFGAASYTSLEGTVDPMHALGVLLHKAQQFGAKIEYPCEVTGLDMAGDQVRGLQTTRGPMEADAFVLASGVDTPRLAQMAGLTVPLRESAGILAHSSPQARILEQVLLQAPTLSRTSTVELLPAGLWRIRHHRYQLGSRKETI